MPPEGSFRGELLPYQQQGLAFLLGARRCLLADEMGLGKTVQALAFPGGDGGLSRHSGGAATWCGTGSGMAGLPEHIRVHVIKGLTPYELPPADIYIAHYLLLRGWKDVCPNWG